MGNIGVMIRLSSKSNLPGFSARSLVTHLAAAGNRPVVPSMMTQ